MKSLLAKRKPDARVVLWEPYRLLYYRVPKSGNTSIAAAIPKGEKTRVFSKEVAREYPGWLTFSFVRNPFARLVSIFFQKIHPEKFTKGNVIDGVHHRFVEMKLPMYAGMPFEEFVEIICDLDDRHTEKHLKSQSHYLYRKGRLLPAFVGRLERMSEDWDELAERAGVPYRIPHLNRTEHRHYSDYFPEPTLRKRVADRYRLDLDNFGYEFETR